MSKKWIAGAALTTLSLVSLTACTDNTQVKETVQQSLTKQSEMKSYTFEGSTTLSIGNDVLKSANPLTNELLSLVKESTITWKGISNLDPLQYQTDLQITPKGSTSPFEIPILIKDSKMYFNIPALNKGTDEFFALDLQKLSAGSTGPLNADTLKNTPQVTTAMSKLVLDGLDAKWFKEANDPIKLKDGTSAKSITIELTNKNEKEINTAIQAKMPEFLSTLQTNGLLTADKAEQFQKNGLQLKAPGKIALAIDDQGFARDQSLDLTFLLTVDGKPQESHVILHQAFDAINQNTPLTREVPAKAKNFEDILKFLAPATKK
ncbi:hypothetical protein [Paenibacillus whitsoniae]|uniref:Uncharacterized protein n=1 Tax=Paenibacillus whitsoniae TaxID=2496558 RepID=A0A430J9U7_9BACL|nr:hypothetical protein [Paenibacillus whitsoniae]RTE07700.1 hypothetical protein EJQ19_20685 [Paenibacillus whitsoniae]